MIKYHVKKRRRTRYTFRLTGFVICLVCLSQIIAFLMGYGHAYKIGTFIAFIFMMYGIYLFASSFRSSAYDIDYEFNEDNFIIGTIYGRKTYTYDQITDLNQIIPENELLYSVIQIMIGKKQYVLPFSYKKDVADSIYNLLNEKTTEQLLAGVNKEHQED